MKNGPANTALRRTSTSAALALVLVLGLGGAANAAPTPAKPTINAAQATKAASVRWYYMGKYQWHVCNVYGIYWMRTGQIRNYQCLMYNQWTMSHMLVLM
ncbi:hypothetical protein OHA37_38940 [Streptomyces sp. NBC_00335]|uniref:hypothetical protein n=1 Tax=unclassified Streptomyces TaxID=2593676 RepID=UPI00224D9E4F|nr:MULTISPECIES: hypothetical protein [unclassified Streptomyces]MCX5409811.1 hypothetical protein [Streptomyces sp. NBC_00086]